MLRFEQCYACIFAAPALNCSLPLRLQACGKLCASSVRFRRLGCVGQQVVVEGCAVHVKQTIVQALKSLKGFCLTCLNLFALNVKCGRGHLVSPSGGKRLRAECGFGVAAQNASWSGQASVQCRTAGPFHAFVACLKGYILYICTYIIYTC